jgi:hypothetical protein
MANAAARAGLLGAVGMVMAAGGAADATETPPMTKAEAKGFKKEIAAKLKAFEAKIRGIEAEEERRFEDEVGVLDDNADLPAMQSIQEDAARARAAASEEFLDALRACLDAANDDDPHHADATAGSAVRNAVAKADATLARESLQTDATLQKLQAGARLACRPVAIATNPLSLRCNYLPDGTLREDLGGEPAPRPVISFAAATGEGDLHIVASFACDAPHDHGAECRSPGVRIVIESAAGTQEVLGTAEDSVFDATLEAVWPVGDGRVEGIVTVSNTTGRGLITATASLSTPAWPVERPPPCEEPTASYFIEGVAQPVDGFGTAVRIGLTGGTSFYGAFSNYDGNAGQFTLGMFLGDGGPVSGERVFQTIVGDPPQDEDFARVTWQGVEMAGTLTILDLDAVVNPAAATQLRCRFEAAAGSEKGELCIPQGFIDNSHVE